MIRIVSDLVYQLSILVLLSGSLVGLLVLFELSRRGLEKWKAENSETRACTRIGVDQVYGVAERISAADVHERQLEEQARRSRNPRTRSSARLESVAGSGGPAVLR